MEELRQNAEPNIIIMLVGNKLDLVEKDPTARQARISLMRGLEQPRNSSNEPRMPRFEHVFSLGEADEGL